MPVRRPPQLLFAVAALLALSCGGGGTPIDRRRVTRLGIPVNFILRRVGTLGTLLQEERTFAENCGRGGARVVTTISSMGVGDIVHLEEVGGPFKTRANVRGSYVGRDDIRRLNLQFLASPAHGCDSFGPRIRQRSDLVQLDSLHRRQSRYGREPD